MKKSLRRVSISFLHPALLGIMLATASHVFAAERVELEVTPSLQSSLAARANAPVTAAEVIGLSSQELQPTRSKTYPSGAIVTRYQQLHQGVPVWGEAVTEHRAHARAHPALSGAVLRNLAADLPGIKPTYSTTEALMLAKTQSRVNGATENDQSKLYVKLGANRVAHLIYIVSFLITDAPKPSRPFYMIDGNTGAVLEKWEGIQHLDATGPGGNQKTGKYEYGIQYGPLVVSDNCTMSSANVVAVDLKNATSGVTPFHFDCPRNTFKEVNGAYSPINDAYFFGTAVFNMYHDYLNLRPISQTLLMKVHYSRNYENAFWDGRR